VDNFYEILEVPSTATEKEIQRAYRELVQVWHPDRFQGNPELLKRAEEKTKQLNVAFRHLSNPQLRSQHDESLIRARTASEGSSGHPSGPPPAQHDQEIALVVCPNPACEVGLRIPTKRRLKVACPRCNTRFMYDSTLESAWNVHIPEGSEDVGTSQAENRSAAFLRSALRKPIVWGILIVALLVILNSGRPVSQPSPSSTMSHQSSMPKERSVVVPPVGTRTGDSGSSSHASSEAGQNLSRPIPSAERQPISRPTGTRIGRYRVPHGRGNLRIVNGTDLDAVVRLGEYAEQRRLLVSLYVKAGQEAVIHDIGEGAYRLAFSLGIDWDQATKGFRRHKAYQVFDEPFEFQETREVREVRTDEGLEVQTTIGSTQAVITLHRVPGGRARTSSIDDKTFDRLFEDRE